MQNQSSESRHGGEAAERKLLHWVNSLPLTSCLLVEELSDLRFGDVLDDIVAWIQSERSDTTASTWPHLRSGRSQIDDVVEFAASNSGAVDQDDVHIIHSERCVSRVADGDPIAISALLSVLKRVAESKIAASRSQEQLARDHRRRDIRSSLASALSPPASPLRVDRAAQNVPIQPTSCTHAQSAGATESWTKRHQFRSAKAVDDRPLTKRVSKLKIEQDENTQQPNSRTPQRKHRHVNCSPDIEAKAREAMQWIASFAALPAQDSTTEPSASGAFRQLRDGVALCIVAATIAYRRGSVAMRYKLQQVRPKGSPHDVAFPRGATVNPRTIAEKKHNLKIAWDLLAECQSLPLSAVSSDTGFVGLFFDDEPKTSDRLWILLCGIKDKLARGPLMAISKPISSPKFTMDPQHKQRKRRPYITAEQMDVVKRWMKTIGVDPNAVASGIFQDTFRNGVALCRVLLHLRPTICKEFQPKFSPKTILDVRQNITGVIQKARSLRAEGLQLPAVYLSSDAVESIMMGDKQIVCGILWHLMQFEKDEESRKSAVRVQVEEAPVETPPFEVDTFIVPEKITMNHRDAVRHSKLSVFELDVPASELLGDQGGLGDSSAPMGATAVWWDASSATDDIVPAAAHSLYARVSDDGGDIRPRKRPVTATPAATHSLREQCPPPVLTPATTTVIDASQAQRLEVPVADTSQHCGNGNMSSGQVEDHRVDDITSPRSLVTRRDVDMLLHWLAGLGVELQQPADLQTPGATLVEFQSGILLCSIIEKLEHMRVMEGVDRKLPVAKASALHNIDKALSILERKRTIPIQLLRRKMKIYEGDRLMILDLLLSIRKAYGHHFLH